MEHGHGTMTNMGTIAWTKNLQQKDLLEIFYSGLTVVP